MTQWKIENWEFNDYDGQFPLVGASACGDKSIEIIDDKTIEIVNEVDMNDGQGGAYKQDVYLEIPLEVMAEVFRMQGYVVKK